MTTIKSFRLNESALQNLTNLASQFELSESRIINILLSQKSHKSGLDFGKYEAELILKGYFYEKSIMEAGKD